MQDEGSRTSANNILEQATYDDGAVPQAKYRLLVNGLADKRCVRCWRQRWIQVAILHTFRERQKRNAPQMCASAIGTVDGEVLFCENGATTRGGFLISALVSGHAGFQQREMESKIAALGSATIEAGQAW